MGSWHDASRTALSARRAGRCGSGWTFLRATLTREGSDVSAGLDPALQKGPTAADVAELDIFGFAPRPFIINLEAAIDPSLKLPTVFLVLPPLLRPRVTCPM